MSSRLIRLAALAICAAAVLATAAGAAAHPFGEPQTVRISAEGDRVLVRWQAPADDLRMLGGALGALPERQVIVIEPDAEPTPVGASEEELLRESSELADYLADNIAVRQGAAPCEATVDLADILGDGALVTFDCPEPVATVDIEVSLLLEFHDAYRTAAFGSGTTPSEWMYTSSDTSHTWSFEGEGAAADASGPDDTAGGTDAALLRAFDGNAALPLALLIALVVGAGHGLAPGHGKTVAAAYLVGTHARRHHALALAGIVAAMHTASVLALGLAWWALVDDGAVPIESVTTWGQVAVGLIVAVLGVVIVVRRWRERGTHTHGPPPEVEPWSRAGLAGIASAGGLIPSPSAFLVLIGGLLTGRGWFATAMVLAFGIGLAVTVLAAGLLTLAGRDWLSRRAAHHHHGHRFTTVLTRLPLLGGVAVVIGGLVLAGGTAAL